MIEALSLYDFIIWKAEKDGYVFPDDIELFIDNFTETLEELRDGVYFRLSELFLESAQSVQDCAKGNG